MLHYHWPSVYLQLILAFISSKLLFPYKGYKSYNELWLPVSKLVSALARSFTYGLRLGEPGV